MPLARRAAARAAASTESSKSIVPTTSERLAGSATKGVAKSLRLGPAVEAARGVARCARTHQSRPPLAEHPLDLVGEQQQGRQRRRVVGLLLARVVERRLQREEVGLPAAGGAVELLDPGDRGRAEQRPARGRRRRRRTSAGRSSRRRPRRRRRAGRRRPRWRRSGPGRRRRRRGARPATMTPVEVSLWAQAIDVGGGVGGRRRRVAGLGLDHDRVGEEGRARGRLGELRRELAVGRGAGRARARARRRRRPRRRWCRRCRARPRSRRAAQKSSARPAAHAADQVADRRLAVRGAHQRPTRSASAASASGRTFEGPQPKRPSAGFSSAGICGGGRERSSGGDRLLT